jgi:drug/metabolite transporter (DMT)-like permease
VATGLVLLVAAVWAGSFLAGLLIDQYSPPASVNAIFSAVMTALLVDRHRRAGGGPEDTEDTRDKPHPAAKSRRR